MAAVALTELLRAAVELGLKEERSLFYNQGPIDLSLGAAANSSIPIVSLCLLVFFCPIRKLKKHCLGIANGAMKGMIRLYPIPGRC